MRSVMPRRLKVPSKPIARWKKEMICFPVGRGPPRVLRWSYRLNVRLPRCIRMRRARILGQSSLTLTGRVFYAGTERSVVFQVWRL